MKGEVLILKDEKKNNGEKQKKIVGESGKSPKNYIKIKTFPSISHSKFMTQGSVKI